MHKTDCVLLNDWVTASDESEGKWKEAEAARREYTSWKLQAEKIEENSRKIFNQDIWWNEKIFFFCKYTFIALSVEKYNGYVGGSSVTRCVRKSILECRICGNCFVSYGPKWLPVIVATTFCRWCLYRSGAGTPCSEARWNAVLSVCAYLKL